MGTKRYRGALTLICCCLHGDTANLVRNRSAPPKMLRDLRVNRIEPPRAMTRRCGLPGGRRRKPARPRAPPAGHEPLLAPLRAPALPAPDILRLSSGPAGSRGGARRRSAHGARPCNGRRVARSSGMQAHAHAHARHPSTVPPRRAPDHGTARADAPGEGHADFHATRTKCHGPPRHHAEAPPSCAGKRQGLRASRRCGPGRARR